MPLAEVPINCSPRHECECKSDPWHRVLLLVLCCAATRLLQLQNTSDPWHSVQLLVLCVYLLEWLWSSRFSCRWYFWKYCWTASTVKSAVPLLTNCMLWQAMQICTRVQQFLYKAQQLKDSWHSSIYATVLFPASGTACLSASSASHSLPSQLWVFHMLHTQRVAPPLTTLVTLGSKDPILRSHGSHWPVPDTYGCYLS